MRNVLLAVWAAVVVTGCTGIPRQPAGSAPSSTAPDSRASTATASPVESPLLVLTADLDEPPVRWTRVAFLPFGDDRAELGFKTFHEGPSSLPSALAVAPDGSFWIDDRWKRRVVHYSAAGAFLGDAGPLAGPGWDLAFQDGVLFVLVDQMDGVVGKVQDGSVAHVGVTYRGDPLFAFQMIPTSRGLVAEAGLIPGARQSDLGSFVLLDLPRPEAVAVLPGLPVGESGVSFDVWPSPEAAEQLGDQDYDLHFTSAETSQKQPVHFGLIAHDHGKRRSIPAEVGLTEPIVVGDDVLFLVKVAPTRPGDADRFGGGRWLLRVGTSPLLWERLPYPETLDELQHRHLAVGPDGSIYLMVVGKGGELILRRPAPEA